MKHKTLFIICLCAALIIALIAAVICVHIMSADISSVVWYKDIPPVISHENAYIEYFDYSSLNEEIKTIHPSERDELLALPDETLTGLSTYGLLVTCLDYPLFGNIVFYDSLTEGFENVSHAYNGLSELLSRDDIGAVIIDFYKQVEYENVIKTDKYGTLRLKYLELMIASDEVIQTMTYDMRQELLRACIDKFTVAVDEYDDVISPFTTALIAGRILYIDCEEFREIADSEEVVMDFLNGSGATIRDELWDRIVDCVKTYVR